MDRRRVLRRVSRLGEEIQNIVTGQPSQLRRLAGPYRGHVDGCRGKELHGWVQRRGADRPLRVGLFVEGGLIDSQDATVFRADVAKGGLGDGNCGFVFSLDNTAGLIETPRKSAVTVRVLDHSAFEVGTLNLSALEIEGGQIAEQRIEKLHSLLYGDLAHLRGLISKPLPKRMEYAAPMASHQPLFETMQFSSENGYEHDKIYRLPAYVEYTLHRLNKAQDWDFSGTRSGYDQALYWYVFGYARQRQGNRIPLSAELIRYFNEPVSMGNQPEPLPRILWWRLLDLPGWVQSINLRDPIWIENLFYWWASEEAPGLGVEDCLIPPAIIDRLSAVPVERRFDSFPLSVFMAKFFAQQEQFNFLNPLDATDRKLMSLIWLVLCTKRPDLFWYLPAPSLTALTATNSVEPSFLDRSLAQLLKIDGPITDFWSQIDRGLQAQGFDFQSKQFRTKTSSGHRLQSAQIGRISDAERCDIQLIGPLKKASGLGQATRLSQAALKGSGYELNSVDFGLDNPAPEGFSSNVESAGYKKAQINLLHLNAESVPLAFAYAPDVFSGSYNIGYFFWELDTPAKCHYLGMRLLDEIWVASRYGVEIYQNHVDIPVSNVGMCFEALPSLDKAVARHFLNRRFGFSGSEFVFLVAFDSYSFVQRKNPIGVLRAFQLAFPSSSSVRLVIKTQNRTNVLDPKQRQIWAKIDEIVAKDPRIMILNETLSYDDLIKLKAGSDCYLSLHKSEGWGFGMIEAMNLKTPVVATGYSGNLEFCTEETAWLVKSTPEMLRHDDYIFVEPGQAWVQPSIEDAAEKMRSVVANPALRQTRVEAAFDLVQTKFSEAAIGKRYKDRLDDIMRTRASE